MKFIRKLVELRKLIKLSAFALLNSNGTSLFET